MLNNIMTLKSRLEVSQGRSN